MDAYESAKRAVPRLAGPGEVSVVVDTLTVPTCAQDAARIEAGEKPKIRKVWVHGAETAYWQAGEPVLPYGRDWFSTGMIEAQNNQLDNLGGLGLSSRLQQDR